VIIKDVNQPETPIHAELLVMPQKLGCLAAAYIPIMRDDQFTALMILGSHERGTLTQTTLQPHVSLADQVTTALDKVIALRSTEQRLNELQTLNTLSQLILTETELSELFGIIHNQVKELIGDVTYYIALYDPDTDYIEIPYVYEDGIVSNLTPFPMGEGLTSHVIRTGQPLMIVENAELRAREIGVKLSGNLAKSWLGIPLMVAGEVIGVLTVQDQEHEHSFDQDDLRLFSTLASQIAGAIHSARILEESKRRAIQLQTASEIARDTSGTLERDELLRKAINLVRERYNFYHASVFLLDSSGEYAIVRESTGEAGRQMIAAGHKLQVGSQSVIGHVTETGQPLVVNDVTKDPTHRFNPLLPDTHAELGIPLKVGNQVLGALDVQSTTPYAFSPDDIEVLEILADQLAVAVANANLFAETQEHLAQHRLIHHVTTVAASSTSVDDALSSAVQGLRVALGDRVSILLVNVEKSYLQISASSGYEQDLSGMEIEIGKGITGWVAENREALIVNDVLTDPRYLPGDQAVRSEIAVPLIYRGELLGVLNVESDQTNAFDEHDMDILGTLAGSLAAIIVNARLTERQRMLFEVTNKIRRSTNMENILQTTANELSKAMKARRARIELGIKDVVTEPSIDANPDNGKDGN
jgi:GAF domain-containing protein